MTAWIFAGEIFGMVLAVGGLLAFALYMKNRKRVAFYVVCPTCHHEHVWYDEPETDKPIYDARAAYIVERLAGRTGRRERVVGALDLCKICGADLFIAWMDTPWWRQRVEADRVLKAQREKAAAYNEAIDTELRAQAAGGPKP